MNNFFLKVWAMFGTPAGVVRGIERSIQKLLLIASFQQHMAEAKLDAAKGLVAKANQNTKMADDALAIAGRFSALIAPAATTTPEEVAPKEGE